MSDRAARIMTRMVPRALDARDVRSRVHGALTSPECAGALSGLHSAAVWLLRARYLDDEQAEASIRLWIRAATIRVSHDEGWQGTEHRRKMLIADIVMDDLFPARCGVCKGRGSVPDERGRAQACPPCAGRGRMLPSGRDKAARLGVRYQTWANRWAPRAAGILRYVQDIEAEAVRAVTGGA